MKTQTPAGYLTIHEAAAHLGLSSPGSVYRKLDLLGAITDGDGKKLLEMNGLRERWQAVTRPKQPHPGTRKRAQPPKQPPPEPADDLPEYTISRARSEFEKANLLELQRKTQERELLRREDVQQAWSQAVNLTRTKLLGVPSTVKQRIPHLEVEEIEVITGLIREALDELAGGEVAA